MKHKLTPRTEYALKRSHLPMNNAADFLAAGDATMAGKVWHAGMKVAIECYRFGGLGVYQIHNLIGKSCSIEWLKWYCYQLDCRK